MVRILEQYGPAERKPMTQELQNPKGANRFGFGLNPLAPQVREEAQAYFFEALRRVCPELLYSLRDEFLRIYEERVATQKSGRRYVLASYSELQRQEPEIAAAVLSWCARYHLVGSVEPEPDRHGPDWHHVAHLRSLWPAVRIHETLLAWSRPEYSHWSRTDPPEWPQTIRVVGHAGVPRRLAVPLPDWEECRTRAEYVKRTTMAFKSLLRLHLAQAERDAEARAMGQRAPLLKTQTAHYEWLALMQVKGLSARAIADWHEQHHGGRVEVKAIRMGVKTTADAIGLLLRRRRPGRPRKWAIPTD
jgi:hypothetical protein